jgi:hypothetical protein
VSVSSYTNVGKVLALYPAVGSAANVTSGTIFEYVTAATDEIDGRLAQLYALPIPNGVPLLQTLATRLATADLMTWRALAHVGADQQGKSPFFARLKECRDLLDRLCNGAVLLDSTGARVPPLGGLAPTTTRGYQPTFQEDSWVDAVVDPSKLDAIAGKRGLTP